MDNNEDQNDLFGSNLSPEDEADLAPTPKAEAKPAAKPRARSKPKAEAKAPAPTTPKASDRVKIVLEENDHIPPNGLFLGLNGKGYLLKPGEVANVPEGVVGILKDAIVSMPIVDPRSQQIVGYRDRMRYPFRMA